MQNVSRQTYSVEEVARILGISKNHCYKVVKAGILSSITLLGRMVIPKAVVDDLLVPKEKISRLTKSNRNDKNPFDINLERNREISGEFCRNNNDGPVTIDQKAQGHDREN